MKLKFYSGNKVVSCHIREDFSTSHFVQGIILDLVNKKFRILETYAIHQYHHNHRTKMKLLLGHLHKKNREISNIILRAMEKYEEN